MKNAFANGEEAVRARSTSQSICSRIARASSSTSWNVAVHVMGRDFWIFDLEPAPPRSEVAVE